MSFSAINYINPAGTNFAYRIRELNNDWIGIGSRNFITLFGLKPGRYLLEVKAGNEDGIWGESKQIVLVFLPKWYQSVFFRIMLVLAALGILYSIYRYRISQIRKQQLIRKDIASDLHDDIGSTLNSVKIFTHLAKLNPNEKEHLEQIEASLTYATLGLRDMIWVLDDSRDTIYEVMERIKKFAVPVCQANNVKLRTVIEVDTDQKTLTKTGKRNYLLIAKETINNSLKYSECQNIYVEFRQKKGKVSLIIRDDGKGFDINTISEGNGLRNIAYRAKQINGISEINSRAGEGTTVIITNK